MATHAAVAAEERGERRDGRAGAPRRPLVYRGGREKVRREENDGRGELRHEERGDVARDGRRRLRVVAVVARAAAVVAERRRRRRASLADRRTVTAEAAAEGGVRVLRCAIVVVAAGGPR